MRLRKLIGFGMAAATAVRHLAQGNGAYSFSRRNVVITGGSRGLGLLMAKEFAEQGASVALLARAQDELAEAERRLRQITSSVMTVTVDVTLREDAQLAVDQVRRKLGAIDVLVNNAGTMVVGPYETMTLDDFRDSLETHFWASYFMTEAVLPDMRRQRSGRIVNISSIGGVIGVPHLVPYCVGKFALTGYSESIRAELAQYGVRVTTVCPGLMRTGSPPNALFRGKHGAEYAWFSTAAAMPGISMSARRAARSVVLACQRGRARLILTVPANLAVYANALTPRATAAAMELTARLLPSAEGGTREARSGRQSARASQRTSWFESMNRKAAFENNEI